jgi:hypothetical protein
MVVVGGSGLVATFVLLAVWQKITPRSVARAIRG